MSVVEAPQPVVFCYGRPHRLIQMCCNLQLKIILINNLLAFGKKLESQLFHNLYLSGGVILDACGCIESILLTPLQSGTNSAI